MCRTWVIVLFVAFLNVVCSFWKNEPPDTRKSQAGRQAKTIKRNQAKRTQKKEKEKTGHERTRARNTCCTSHQSHSYEYFSGLCKNVQNRRVCAIRVAVDTGHTATQNPEWLSCCGAQPECVRGLFPLCSPLLFFKGDLLG